MRLLIFTGIVRWTMTRAEYERRCRRYEAGWGFRWLGFDWFKGT
jgi:hypothetical protein